MIKGPKITPDSAGFPIVSWWEQRNMMSPQSMRGAFIECRIMKDGDGNLLFTRSGTARDGGFVVGKPWAALKAISTHPAKGLYYRQEELDMLGQLGSKSVGLKQALNDGATVVQAEFEGDTPIHINCADASPVDVNRLEVALRQAFATGHHDLIASHKVCRGEFKWPVGDDRVMSFDAAPTSWPALSKKELLVEAVQWALALLVVVGILGGMFWYLGVLRF